MESLPDLGGAIDCHKRAVAAHVFEIWLAARGRGGQTRRDTARELNLAHGETVMIV